VDEYFKDTKHILMKSLEDLEYRKELLVRAIESLNNVKYKFGDFIITKTKNKGYITGVYTASQVIYSNLYTDRNLLDDLNRSSLPDKSLTLESFLKTVDKDQVFYTCNIFEPATVGSYTNSLRKVIVKQEDLMPYTDKAKLLYDK